MHVAGIGILYRKPEFCSIVRRESRLDRREVGRASRYRRQCQTTLSIVKRSHPVCALGSIKRVYRRERWWERRPPASKSSETAAFYFRPRTLHPPLSKLVAVKLGVKNSPQERIRLSISRTGYRYRGFESPLPWGSPEIRAFQAPISLEIFPVSPPKNLWFMVCPPLSGQRHTLLASPYAAAPHRLISSEFLRLG